MDNSSPRDAGSAEPISNGVVTKEESQHVCDGAEPTDAAADLLERQKELQQELEFEALRAVITARAITEACLTKGRVLFPGYCNRQRFPKSSQQRPPPLPELSSFLGGLGPALPLSQRSEEGGSHPALLPSGNSAFELRRSAVDGARSDVHVLASSAHVKEEPPPIYNAPQNSAALFASSSVHPNVLHPVLPPVLPNFLTVAPADPSSHKEEKLHRCEECFATFTRSSTLKRHLKLHRGIKDRPFKCTECTSSFAYNNHLKTHMRIHTGERPFACDVCGAAFARSDGLKIHRRKHTGERPYSCAHCSARFSVAHHLKEHMRTHASDSVAEAAPSTSSASAPLHMCPECGDELPTAALLRRHMTSHVRKQSAAADTLAAPPGSPSSISGGDTAQPHRSAPRSVALPCASADADVALANGQSRSRSSGPPTREEELTNPSKTLAEAERLGAEVANISSEILNGSVIATGSTKKPFKCESCPFSFQCRAHLATHMRIHTGERPYACTECTASFARPDGLKIHRRTHTGERPYSCNKCDARFAMAHHLRQHARRHTGEKPFMCPECGDDFSTANRLKQHRRVHTGEKPFECTVCKARFTWSDYLRVHMRTHTGERPYACSDCGAAFARSDILKVHRRTHTGERPYTCRDCAAAFKTLGQLQSHGRVHHGHTARGVAAVTTDAASGVMNGPDCGLVSGCREPSGAEADEQHSDFTDHADDEMECDSLSGISSSSSANDDALDGSDEA